MNQLIDTNYLRKRSDEDEAPLETALKAASPGDRFVISDGVIIETMKNPNWESTARQSFEIISRYPNLVTVASGPSKFMKIEVETGQDTTDVIDEELTGGFRQLLGEIASGHDGPAIANVRGNIVAAQGKLTQQQQNHTQNLASLREAFNAVKQLVKREDYKSLPSDNSKRLFRMQFAKTMAQLAARNVAEEEGRGQAIGDALAVGKGFMIRLLIGYHLLGFKWFVNQGLDSFPEEKATNEMMDLDHAVTSTFCDGILSKESWLATMRQDILDALGVEPLTFPEKDTNTSN